MNRQPSLLRRLAFCALPLALIAPLVFAFTGPVTSTDIGSFSSIARATGLSALVGLIATFVAGVLGIAAGWCLAKRSTVFTLACTALPLALAPSVAISGWLRWIAPDAASSFALPVPGFTSLGRTLLFSPVGAGVVLGLNLWPVVAFYTWPGFVAARDEAYTAALTLGSQWRAFFKTILPRARGEISGGLLLVFLLAAGDFSVCSLLLVKSLAVEAHDRIALGKLGAAGVLSLPLAFACVIGAVMSIILNVKHCTRTESMRSRETPAPWGISDSALWFGVALGFGAPMLGCLQGVWSAAHGFSSAFKAGATALDLSLRLAAAVAIVTGVAGAFRLLLRDRFAALNAATLFNLCIPGALIAAAALSLQMNTRQIIEAPLAWLAAAIAFRFLFVPLRLAEEALAHSDPALTESAALLGASPIARWLSVTLPLALPHLSAAAALVFVLALGEVAITAVLAPPGAATATLWLFNQQHMGYDESVFGLSLLLGCVAAGAVALGAFAIKQVAR